ncbi:hypothetical protein ACWA5Z_06575 [Testudinibacter sp. P80/BLE/0925]
MARNELTRSAIPISDLVMDKFYHGQTQAVTADKMGCSPTTVSRLVGENGDKLTQFFNLLSAVDVGVYDKNTQVCVSKQDLEALLLMSTGFELRLREKYFGQ